MLIVRRSLLTPAGARWVEEAGRARRKRKEEEDVAYLKCGKHTAWLPS